jgi:hypothetical protein
MPVAYRVTATARAVSPYNGNTIEFTKIFVFTGPITRISPFIGATYSRCKLNPDDESADGWDSITVPGQSSLFIRAVNEAGDERRRYHSSPDIDWGLEQCTPREDVITPSDAAEMTSITIERVDGLPDTGGDPTGIIIEPGIDVPEPTVSPRRPPPLEDEPDRRLPPPLLPTPDEIILPSPRFLPSAPPGEPLLPGVDPGLAEEIANDLAPAPAPAPELDPTITPAPTDDPLPEIQPPSPLPPATPTAPGDDDEEEPRRLGLPIVLQQLRPSQFIPTDSFDVEDLFNPLPEPDRIIIPPNPPVCVCTVEIEREGRRTREDIKEALEDLLGEGEFAISQAFCDTTGDEPVDNVRTEPFQDIADAISALSQEVANIRLQLGVCPPQAIPQEPATVLASGTSTESKTTEYVEINVQVRQVELIITGQIPTAFRLYRNDPDGEMQGKFGNLCIAYAGSTGGFAPDAFQQWCWTRRTILDVGSPLRNPRYVRIFVRPGLSWVLYDTGLRN